MRNLGWVIALVAIGCGGNSEDGTGATGGKAGTGGSSASGGSTSGGSGGSVGGKGGTPSGGSGGTPSGGSGGVAGGAASGGVAGAGGVTGGGTGGTGGTATTGGTGGTATTGGTGGTATTGGTGGTATTGGTGGTATTGGTGGTATTGGTGGTATTGGTGGTATGGTGGTGGVGGCGSTTCGFTCCGNQCANTDNDIKNCGSCGTICGGATPFCDQGACKTTPPCNGVACIGTKFCCGTQCCDYSQLCCEVPGPVVTGPACTTPVNGTCPVGCKGCVCNSPDTRIATPAGEREIADLKLGDLVYSVHHGAVVAVPIRLINRKEAPHHVVVELRLATGNVLRISPLHPTADGRVFGELVLGDRLDGVSVEAARLVPFEHTHTYDILPDSDTGTYYAGGVLIGSTITGAASGVPSCGAISAPRSH